MLETYQKALMKGKETVENHVGKSKYYADGSPESLFSFVHSNFQDWALKFLKVLRLNMKYKEDIVLFMDLLTQIDDNETLADVENLTKTSYLAGLTDGIRLMAISKADEEVRDVAMKLVDMADVDKIVANLRANVHSAVLTALTGKYFERF